MSNVLHAGLPGHSVKPPEGFKEAAAKQGILVLLDEYGIAIARQREIEGQIYFRAVDVSEQVQDRARWKSLFQTLDREFASHLAWHGIIPLPQEFR